MTKNKGIHILTSRNNDLHYLTSKEAYIIALKQSIACLFHLLVQWTTTPVMFLDLRPPSVIEKIFITFKYNKNLIFIYSTCNLNLHCLRNPIKYTIWGSQICKLFKTLLVSQYVLKIQEKYNILLNLS